jgi:GTP cyclohydrolase IA
MKQKETLLNIRLNGDKIELSDLLIDDMGDNHVSTSVDTPMRKDAFEMSDEEKVKTIEKHFTAIMETLGLDLTDDSLKGTPKRVAKMYVKEIFSGLNPKNMPKMAMFENKYKYNEMLVEKNISFYSNCEHHFVPIFGKAHIAYISNGTVVGLSKLNRLVQYFAKRPQVQERLTMQIGKELQKVLGTEDVEALKTILLQRLQHIMVESLKKKKHTMNFYAI